MKLIINGEEAKIPFGSSGGVTMDQVNSAIETKLDTYEPQEVYSTEEVRIGTWIDGKPLYRKCYTFVSPSNTNTVRAVSIADIKWETMVRCTCNLQNTEAGTGKRFVIPNCFVHGSDTVLIWVDSDTICVAVGSSTFFNQPYICILEYTKTTDQAQTTAANTVLKASSKAPVLSSIPSAAVTASAQEVLIDG